MEDLKHRLQQILGDGYSVERALGAGGMAVVFLAHDRKHDRQVAIKVLRPEVAVSVGPERFLREIQIAARLQHPHVLPLYDSGSGDGLIYYVMPHVEGESLRERIARDGPLPIPDAVEIASEVASALEYAHQEGVIHRDIKPANVLLSRGHAVVADFGIARALRLAGPDLTQFGMIVGTPEYMSPEQAVSGVHIDGRSDVYSLGCVLFEMLTGRPPFEAPTLEAAITKAVTADVPSVRASRPAVPLWLDEVVARATAKRPEDRFATADELRAALEHPQRVALVPRRWRRALAFAAALVVALVVMLAWWLPRMGIAPGVASDAEVIAVLPFVVEGPGVELLGQGMADLIATNLDGVGGIRTVDSRSVMQRLPRRVRVDALDRDRALQAGRGVKAGSVLLGSLVSAAGRIRATAELYSVGGNLLTRAVAEGPIDSLFALADSLSLKLVRDVWRSREPVPDFRVSAITTGSLDAIRAYLAGEQYFRASQWDSAAAAFERAVEADSTFALALLRLSIVQGWVAGHGDSLALRYSADASRRATRLPTRERLLVTGNELFHRGDLAGVDSLRAYAARYPNDAEGWYFLGETQFHAQPLIALTVSELLAPYDQVLTHDSTLTPAMIHPLELTLLFPDSDRNQEYLRRLEAHGAAKQIEFYRWLSSVAWDGRRVGTADIARAVDEHGPVVLSTLTDLALQLPGLDIDTLLAAMDSVWRRFPPQAERDEAFLRQRWGILLAVGRPQQVKAELDSVQPYLQGVAGRFTLRVAAAGYPGWLADAGRALHLDLRRDDWSVASLRAARALSRGMTREARALLAQVDTSAAEAYQRGFAQAMGGWTLVAEGDTANGVARMRRALERTGFEPEATLHTDVLRYRLAEILASRPRSRDEGIRRLRYDWYARASSPFLYPLQLLTLARAQHAGGRTDDAADSYNRLLELWVDADSSLQPVVAEIRKASRQLGARGR